MVVHPSDGVRQSFGWKFPQIFDKALTEVTFTELYAELCVRLAAKLPSFDAPESAEGTQAGRTTFRRCASQTGIKEKI